MSKSCLKNHRDIWIIAGGNLLWCYRCGAWRPNTPGRYIWHKPVGENAENPALTALRRERIITSKSNYED